MSELRAGARRKIYCNTCKIRTHHELKATHHQTIAESDFAGREELDREALIASGEEFEESEYSLWVCCGCDTAILRNDYRFHLEGGDQIHEVHYHPRREKASLPLKFFQRLETKLARIYREIIISFNHDARTLCAVGLRALLEGICAEKGVTGKNLYSKIDGLEAFLPSNIVKSLHRFRFMGNEAAHELQAPSESELRLAIEVIEDLLNFLYELDYKARSLFEGDLADPSTVTPRLTVIALIIERHPRIPRGQKDLYRALYEAFPKGLGIGEMATETNRTKNQIYGVLGALGRRVNNTAGVQGSPGIGYVLQYVHAEDTRGGQEWGWKMRPELHEALKKGNYPWAKDWAK